MILGFDPRYQFVHEDDVVHALEHAVQHDVPGVFNVAGDGVLALSEVSGLLGKPYAPILPPWGTGLAAAPLRRLGRQRPAGDAQPAALRPRARQPQATRRPASTTATRRARPCMKLGEHLRLHPIMRGAREPYRYEREVEEFLRWSPHVRDPRTAEGAALSSRTRSRSCSSCWTRSEPTAGLSASGEDALRAADAERGDRRADASPEPDAAPSRRAARAAAPLARRRLRRPRGRGDHRPARLAGARASSRPCATTSATTRGRDGVLAAIDSAPGPPARRTWRCKRLQARLHSAGT